MQQLTQQLSTHLCLTTFMANFPEHMDNSSSNSFNNYSTNMLAPNNMSKQTIGVKYFVLDGGEEGLVCYEGKVV